MARRFPPSLEVPVRWSPRARPGARYAGPWLGLGQEPAIDAGGAGGTAQDLTAGEASGFKALWARFTSIWPNFLALEKTLVDRAARWRALAVDAYRRGDIEGYRALLARVQKLEALEGQRKAVEGRVRTFKDAWEGLRSYIANAGRWFGVQGETAPGLGLPPLLLIVGIPAALAALGYVINTYTQIQADLDADAEVLRSVEEGRISAEAGAALIAARQPKGLFAGLTTGLTPVVIIGGGLLALLMMGGRR